MLLKLLSSDQLRLVSCNLPDESLFHFCFFCYLSTQLAGEVMATRQISRQVSSPWGHVQVKSQVFTTSFIFSCWRNVTEIKRSLLVTLISVSRRELVNVRWVCFLQLISVVRRTIPETRCAAIRGLPDAVSFILFFFCLIVKNLSLGCFWYQISSQFKCFVRQASTKWNLRVVGSR